MGCLKFIVLLSVFCISCTSVSAISCYSCDSENSAHGDKCRTGTFSSSFETPCRSSVNQCYVLNLSNSGLPFNIVRRGCSDIASPCGPSGLHLPIFNASIGFNQAPSSSSGASGCAFSTCDKDLCNGSVTLVSSIVLLVLSAFVCIVKAL